MNKFQNENEKLWKVLEKGEDNNKFMKDCFEKLINQLQRKDQNLEARTEYPQVENHLHCSHCRTSFDNKSFYRNQRYGSHLPLKNQQDRISHVEIKNKDLLSEKNESMNILREEMEKMRQELMNLKNKKTEEENGLQDIVQKLIEIKAENEDKLRGKENRYDKLSDKFDKLKVKNEKLQNQLDKILKDNRDLEGTVQKFYKNHKGVLVETAQKENTKIKKLKERNLKLKK